MRVWSSKISVAVLAAGCLAVLSGGTRAEIIDGVSFDAKTTFTNITGNSSNDGSDFELQIYDLGEEIGFRFINNSTDGSRIEELYFYDGVLLRGGTLLNNTSPVLFEKDGSAKPKDLPNFTPPVNPDADKSVVTRFYSADGHANGTGILAGGYADITFIRLTDVAPTFADLVASLTTNQTSSRPYPRLYIGMRVQSIQAQGESDSYLAQATSVILVDPHIVPLPAAAWIGMGLFGVIGAVKLRQRVVD